MYVSTNDYFTILQTLVEFIILPDPSAIPMSSVLTDTRHHQPRPSTPEPLTKYCKRDENIINSKKVFYFHNGLTTSRHTGTNQPQQRSGSQTESPSFPCSQDTRSFMDTRVQNIDPSSNTSPVNSQT